MKRTSKRDVVGLLIVMQTGRGLPDCQHLSHSAEPNFKQLCAAGVTAQSERDGGGGMLTQTWHGAVKNNRSPLFPHLLYITAKHKQTALFFFRQPRAKISTGSYENLQ